MLCKRCSTNKHLYLSVGRTRILRWLGRENVARTIYCCGLPSFPHGIRPDLHRMSCPRFIHRRQCPPNLCPRVKRLHTSRNTKYFIKGSDRQGRVVELRVHYYRISYQNSLDTSVHFKYQADFEPARASCAVHIQKIYKQNGTVRQINNLLLVQFMRTKIFLHNS